MMLLKAAGSVPPSVAIACSVGRFGANRREDVRAVQALLNKAGAGIADDGFCGRETISAIEEYQRNWTRQPDGRIDPGGATWRELIAGRFRIRREKYILLPQVSGNGYYSYSGMDRQYGTAATNAALTRICRKLAMRYPDTRVGVGDMSLVDGAPMKPHKTHRNGRSADIRPLRNDGQMLRVALGDVQYSRERTRALVEIIRADINFKSVLFNDSSIVGVVYCAGHDNHLHVSMKE